MKKLLCIVLLTIAGLSAKAQVPNNGFETLNSFNNTSNWGEVHLLVISIDSNGVATGDSIVYDDPQGRLYFPTTDAYQGTYALEMRNAFNYTTGYPMLGHARLSQFEEDYSGFGGTLVPVSTQPAEFSFYYKFFPENTDTAYANITVYDSNAVEIGSATIEIGDPAGNYTFVSKPISYSIDTPAVYVSMEFSNAKPGTPVSLGTRFQVDEVNTTAVGLKENETAAKNDLSCYPVPASDVLNLKLSRASSGVKNIFITDALGKVVLKQEINKSFTHLQLNISELTKGMYFIKLQSDQEVFSGSFVK